MTESPEHRFPMNFSFNGKADEIKKTIFASSSSFDNETKYERTEDEVLRLREIKYEIATEIEAALYQTTGIKFKVNLNFHYGSVEFLGIVSTLATAEVFQASANLGGALALAQTIAAVIKSIISSHLPEWMSQPVTQCRMLTQINQNNSRNQNKAIASKVKNTTSTEKELRYIKWILFGILVVISASAAKMFL